MKKLLAVALLISSAAVAAPKKVPPKAPPPKDAPVDPYADPAPVDPYAATPAKLPAKKDASAKPVDPYALPAPRPEAKDAPAAIPSRVGLSDLTAVQGLLAAEHKGLDTLAGEAQADTGYSGRYVGVRLTGSWRDSLTVTASVEVPVRQRTTETMVVPDYRWRTAFTWRF